MSNATKHIFISLPIKCELRIQFARLLFLSHEEDGSRVLGEEDGRNDDESRDPDAG